MTQKKIYKKYFQPVLWKNSIRYAAILLLKTLVWS